MNKNHFKSEVLLVPNLFKNIKMYKFYKGCKYKYVLTGYILVFNQ